MASFSLSDPPSGAAKLSGVFAAGEVPFPLLDCFKLLWGLADLTETNSGKKLELRFDFAGTKVTRANSSSNKRISSSLFSNELSVDDASTIIAKLRNQNSGFFAKLFTELSFCLVARSRRNHVASFLYLYRATEWLAVSFPLFYFSRKSDFREVNSALKDYFSDDKAKELAALNKFCAFIADQSEILKDLNVTFSSRCNDLTVLESSVAAIHSRLPKKFEDSWSPVDRGFDLSYKYVASLVVTARNLLFHNSNSGQNNFDLDDTGGAETICELLTTGGLAWLALTFSEIVQDRASRVD